MTITEYLNLSTRRKTNPKIRDRYCPNSIRIKEPKIGDVIHYMEISEISCPPEFSEADKVNKIVAFMKKDILEENPKIIK